MISCKFYIRIICIIILSSHISCDDERISLTDKYEYDYDGYRIYGPKIECNIAGEVKTYKVLDGYILAKQEVDKYTYYGVQWKRHYGMDRREYKYGEGLYYWILDTNYDVRFGPYNYKEFVDKCDELGIELF